MPTKSQLEPYGLRASPRYFDARHTFRHPLSNRQDAWCMPFSLIHQFKKKKKTSPPFIFVCLFPSSPGSCQVAVASWLVGCSIRASCLSLVGDSLEGVPLSDSSVAALNGIATRAPLWSRETLRGRYTGNANRREPATKERLATGGVDQKQPTLCPSDTTNREPLHFGSAPHRWGRRQSAPRLTVIRDTRAVRPSCLLRTTRLPFDS